MLKLENKRSSGLLKELVADPLLEEYKEIEDPQQEIAYRPQPRQEDLVKAVGLWDWWNGGGKASRKEPVAELIGYGGAAYGGKTYGMLGTAAMCAWAFPGVQMVFFRRTYSEMDGPGAVMGEANNIFPLAGGKRRDGGKEWSWENGSQFYFRHCEHENDVYNYQSQQFDIMFVDEATHFTWTQIDYLLTRNRATTDNIIKPFGLVFSNPGNIGHSWYMKIFDLEDRDGKTGMERWADDPKPTETWNENDKKQEVYFLPAYLEDNKIGVERDPEYERRLSERHPDTYQALRYGDWNVFTGQAFREWSKPIHVIDPFQIPNHWPKWRAVDKGYGHPFFCLWFTRNPATGRTYVYREVTGTQVTDQDQAFLIAMNTPINEHINITFATPDFWIAKNMGSYVMTSAEEYMKNGIPLLKGNSDRKLGKVTVHNNLALGVDGKPKLQIFSTCAILINILPKLTRQGEDVVKQDGDDPYDCLKIGLTNVSMFGGKGKKPKPKDQYPQRQDEWQQISNML
jgi:hypothetical protein